jgi:Ca-activated chloride channel homolog
VKFLWPGLLWGLLLVPLAVATYLALHRRRRQQASRFGNPALWPNLLPKHPRWRRHLPAVLLLLSLAALLVGLARPQAIVKVPREEGTVVLTLDSSTSMLATDIQPSRLIAARNTADELIKALPPKYQLGVVTFAGRAVTRTLPTTDRDAVRTALDEVEAGGGTAMGEGLRRALEVGGARPPSSVGGVAPQPTPDPERPPLAILLLSDGYSTEGQPPLEVAQLAKQLEVPVFTVALGTQTGLGPDGKPAPPDEATLRQVADITGGRFFSAPTSEDLAAVYADLGSKVSKVDEQREITVAPLAAALLLFLAAGGLSLLWFNRFP